MADYCWQCCEEHLGVPGERNDFATVLRPGELVGALCEGCGPVWVDNEGRCVDNKCPQHGMALAITDEKRGKFS